MELWIRSQNRHKLELVSNRLLVQETTVNPHSHWFGIMVDGSYLAEYNSEERALEVLDEIQKLLQPLIITNYDYDNSLPIINGEWLSSIKETTKSEFKNLPVIVYEMPKE